MFSVKNNNLLALIFLFVSISTWCQEEVLSEKCKQFYSNKSILKYKNHNYDGVQSVLKEIIL